MIINLLEHVNHFLLCSTYAPEFAYKLGRFSTYTTIDWNVTESLTGEEFISFAFPKKININDCKLYLTVVPETGLTANITYSYSYDGINWKELVSFDYGSTIRSFDVNVIHFKISFRNVVSLNVEKIELLGDEIIDLKKYRSEFFDFNSKKHL